MMGQINNLEELTLIMVIAVWARTKTYQQSGESATKSHT